MGSTGKTLRSYKLDLTEALGAFWLPNATGSYTMCAQWDGNATLHWMNATANMVITSDSSGNAFSVASNSTISSFDYDSASQVLSFNTNGTSSTTGYAHICIPKTLVSDIQTLQVSIDGKPAAFTSQSQDDIWIVSCMYTQSEHAFTLQIPFIQALTAETTPWIAIIIVLAAVVALLAVAVVIRRRRRTAATVASILKESRPLH